MAWRSRRTDGDMEYGMGWKEPAFASRSSSPMEGGREEDA